MNEKNKITETQMMSLIIDRLDRIENKLDNRPPCNFPIVEKRLEKGDAKFLRLEAKIDEKVSKQGFVFGVGIVPVAIGVLVFIKEYVLGK